MLYTQKKKSKKISRTFFESLLLLSTVYFEISMNFENENNGKLQMHKKQDVCFN